MVDPGAACTIQRNSGGGGLDHTLLRSVQANEERNHGYRADMLSVGAGAEVIVL